MPTWMLRLMPRLLWENKGLTLPDILQTHSRGLRSLHLATHSNRFKMAHFPYKRLDLTTPGRPELQPDEASTEDSESESEIQKRVSLSNQSQTYSNSEFQRPVSVHAPSNPHSPTSKSGNDTSSDDETEGLYIIDTILMGKHLKNGDRSYLVKWRGYTKPTWIRESAMTPETIKLLKTNPVKMLNKHFRRTNGL